MSRRAWLAIAVLMLWGTTLGWHVKRLHFRGLEEIVLEKARTIPPGVAYYVVERDGERIGWSRTEIDTLPSHGGFLVRERLEATISVAGESIRTSIESEAELGPGLELRRFSLQSRGLLGELGTAGETLGDSILRVVLIRGAEIDTTHLPIDGPVILAAAWPLRFVAQREQIPGRRFRLPLFDPLDASMRSVDVEILAEATRTYPDSATDAGPLWVTAREDTVLAWLVERDLAGLKVRSWIDEDGRLLESEMPAGLRIRRTAFEFAFYGDSVPGSAPEGKAENRAAGGDENEGEGR